MPDPNNPLETALRRIKNIISACCGEDMTTSKAKTIMTLIRRELLEYKEKS